MAKKITLCYSCNSAYEPDGWVGLCGRKCYHDITQELSPFITGDVSELSHKLIKYFLKFPDGGSLSIDNDIELYMQNVLAEKDTRPYSKEIRLMEQDIPTQEKPKHCKRVSWRQNIVDLCMCKCTICGENAEGSGWIDLCSRKCFHELGDLLCLYENGDVDEPDPRIINYFNLHPDGGAHGFYSKRISHCLKK